MADVKINKRYTCGDALTVSNGDNDAPTEYLSITHNATDASEEIGYGSKVVEFSEPLMLADDAYYDLPANTSGYGFVGVGSIWARFYWDTDATVTLIQNSADVTNADTDGYLCVFANTTPNVVRIKNRLASVARFVLKVNYTETPISPAFRAFSVPSGVDQLDPSLTINSTTVTPTLRYKGGDADGTDWNYWTYGEDLTLQTGVALPSYNQGSPCLGTNDDSVLFNTGDYYLSSLDATGDIASEDIVIELIYKVKESATNQTIVHHKNGGGEGWQIQDRSGYTCRLVIEDSATNTVNIESAALTVGTWNHVMFFVNRDEASTNGSQTYVNGVASGSGVDTSAVGSLTAAVKFAIGDANTTGAPFSSNVAYVTMWLRSSWHQAGASGPAEWATIAAERFARLAGFWPEVANGTYAPSTSTRAFNAYIDKVEGDYRKLYYVGSEWLRMCHRIDSNAESVRGYLAETQNQNLIVQSEDFSTWSKFDAGDTVTDEDAECPDGRTAAASLAADTSNNVHGIYTTATLTATTYTFSIFAKPGDKNWINISNTTIGSCNAYFDIANGTIGTVAVNADAYMEGPFYGGYYRCSIVFTGTAFSHQLSFYSAEADGDAVFSGSGADNTYIWGAQVEASDYMTSPVRTSGAAQTRLQDKLRYVAGANIGGEDVGQGTLAWDALFSSYDAGSTKYVGALSDGGASADRIYPAVVAANDRAIVYTRATPDGAVSTFAPNVDVVDDTKHSHRVNWATDDVTYYLDGVAGTNTTSANIPDDIDLLDIGYLQDSTAFSLNGLLQNFRIYSTPTTKG